jgi:GTP-binding protein
MMIVQVRTGLSTLFPLRHARRYVAADGRGGGPNNMSGKAAAPLLIEVPPGTVVFDARTGEQLGDLTAADDRLVVCKGGRGGRGNQHFATSRNQAPRTAERANREQKHLRLESNHRDIGVIVLNAGNHLLAAITNAAEDRAYLFTIWFDRVARPMPTPPSLDIPG